jgi:hypothetical protein
VSLDELHSALAQGGLPDTLAQAHTPKKLLNKKKNAYCRRDASPLAPLTPQLPRLPSPTEFVLAYLAEGGTVEERRRQDMVQREPIAHGQQSKQFQVDTDTLAITTADA